ncbi:protein of unknown function (plasmid) [Rhodovastum atsumiense]|nr:protein of unknown function [Rhodovastum atsumiense]
MKSKLAFFEKIHIAYSKYYYFSKCKYCV